MRRLLAHLTAALAAAIGSLGLVAGVAVADGSATSAGSPPTTVTTPITPTTPTTTPAPKPAPKPAVKGETKLYLSGTFTVGSDEVTVPKRTVELQGFVRPYVSGQSVEVKSSIGRRVIKTDRLRVKPASGGRYGRFTETLQSPVAGVVRVTVTHARTAAMLGFEAQRAFSALDTSTGFGARGPFVTLVQERLAALHVYVPQTGVYDTQTGLALDAYHRVLGWGEGNQGIDAKTVADLLNGDGTFHVRYPGQGNHAEGDLSRQVLALMNGSKVYRIYPISSGKPSTPTVLGSFRVYERVPGYLPDGMYFSSFFYSGYAIHGYDPAPDYPASHGCMRLPIIDAISVFDWITYGDWVDVYYE
ncbi:MAG TPA: L,D-transpeptidase [Solirubrobacteraceae bacterium]